MSKAPERIWANTGLYWDYRQDWTEGSWNLDGSGIEYIRADHVNVLLKEKREAALREALFEIEHMLYGYDCRSKILSLIKGKEE